LALSRSVKFLETQYPSRKITRKEPARIASAPTHETGFPPSTAAHRWRRWGPVRL